MKQRNRKLFSESETAPMVMHVSARSAVGSVAKRTFQLKYVTSNFSVFLQHLLNYLKLNYLKTSIDQKDKHENCSMIMNSHVM